MLRARRRFDAPRAEPKVPDRGCPPRSRERRFARQRNSPSRMGAQPTSLREMTYGGAARVDAQRLVGVDAPVQHDGAPGQGEITQPGDVEVRRSRDGDADSPERGRSARDVRHRIGQPRWEATKYLVEAVIDHA